MFKSAKTLEKVQQILGYSGGGVNKRIDENRELLELLQKEVPDLLERNYWIEGWLKSHDEFFYDVLEAVPIEKGRFLSATKMHSVAFPRPWPGKV